MFADDNLDIPAGYVNTKSVMLLQNLKVKPQRPNLKCWRKTTSLKKTTGDPLFRSPARLNKAANRLRPVIILLEPVINAEQVLSSWLAFAGSPPRQNRFCTDNLSNKTIT
jgi:hypothetical protein